MPGDPWTQKQFAAWFGCGVKTARLLDPPRVELYVRGSERPLVRYDSEEIRAWWAGLVAAAQQRRNATTPAPRRQPAPRPRRGGAIRLEVG